MRYESGQAYKASQASADTSSRPNPSGRDPAGEKSDAASQTSDCSCEIEAYQGFRLWRLINGQLHSQTRDTAWPAAHAVQAEAHLDWRHWGSSELGIQAVVFAVVWLIVTPVVSALLEVSTAGTVAAQWLEDLPVNTRIVVAFGGLCVASSVCYLVSGRSTRAISLIQTFKGALLGQAVVPGLNTPGIFAMRRLADVRTEAIRTSPGQIVVRGSVWIWGDTIEHEYGVKGEYAYPGTIVDVQCSRCPDWIPIAEYADESEPPIHSECLFWRTPGPWEARAEKWRPAGLLDLQVKVPQWFEGKP